MVLSTGIRRRQWLGAAGVAALSAGGSTAASNARQLPASGEIQSASARFGDSIGLGVKFYQGEPVEGLHALIQLRVKWVREGFHWDEFEPVAGYMRGFSGALINRLRFYRRQGIGVVFMLAYGNPKAYPDSPSDPFASIDPKRFARYATEVAKRLRDLDVSFVLEVWNEPHNGEIREKVGGSWQGAGPAPWVHHYVAMVRAVCEEVARVDPTIPVFSQDDMWVTHYWYLEATLPAEVAGFTVHPYQPTPEQAAVDQSCDWCRPFELVDADGSFRSAVRRLQAQGKQKLGKTPRIWITEMGYSLPVDGRKDGVPAERVADFVPRAFIGAFAAGVEVSCWFSSFDGPDGPMGLRSNSGERRPAYRSFAAMTALLSEARLEAQISGSDSLVRGLQRYHFATERQRIDVVWHAGDAPTALDASGASEVRDVYGRPLEPRQGVVRVTGSPVYLIYQRRG